MFDFTSNEEMQLVAKTNAWNVGKNFNKPAPERKPKGFFARLLSFLGLL